MKVLVVLANPKTKCFTRDACATLCEEARARGHEVKLRDLYEMNFNPVASETDLRGNLTGDIAPDVAAEQALVRWADVIAFVHPVWWIDRPAILKGYVDRVFALGFAYGYAANGEVGSLAGRKAVLITSSGSTTENFAETGKADAMYIVQDTYTMEFCGLEMLGHLHFAPVGRRSSPQMIEGYHDTIRNFVREKF